MSGFRWPGKYPAMGQRSIARLTASLIVVLDVVVGASLRAHADTYLAAQVGYTVAQDASRVEVLDPQLARPLPLPSGTTASNIDLKNSVLYGLKLGHYFTVMPWLGVEVETYITTPHVPQQGLTLTSPGLGQIPVTQQGATNRLVVVAPTLLARYRAGMVEPYIGVGPGVFLLHTARRPDVGSSPPYSQSSTSVGLHTQVGLRTYVTTHFSLFGEWKYNYFRAHLSGQAAGSYFGYSADVRLHHFVFGVGYHF